MLQPFPKRTVWETTRANRILWDSASEKLKCCPQEWSSPAAAQAGEQLLRKGSPWGPSGQPQVWLGMSLWAVGRDLLPIPPYLLDYVQFWAHQCKKKIDKWGEFSIVLKLIEVWSTCPVSRNRRNWAYSAWNKHTASGGNQEPLSTSGERYSTAWRESRRQQA